MKQFWKTWKRCFCTRFTAISHCHLPTQHAWSPCVGIHQVMALIGDAKQAMSEGKSGLVETGLTWLVSMALTITWLYLLWILSSVRLTLHVMSKGVASTGSISSSLKYLFPFCRDCVGGTFELPVGPVRQCSTQCSSQTLCVLAQVPEEHLKVK